MNIIDLVILIIFVLFAIRGYVNGFIKEALGIVGLFLAVFLTFKYMDEGSKWLEFIQPYLFMGKSYLPFLAGALIFILVLVFISITGYMLTRFVQAIHLSIPNRILGSVAALIKSGILISAVLLILAGFNVPDPPSRRESVSYPYVIHMAPWAYDLVATVWPGAANFTNTISKTLNKNNPLNEFPIFDN